MRLVEKNLISSRIEGERLLPKALHVQLAEAIVGAELPRVGDQIDLPYRHGRFTRSLRFEDDVLQRLPTATGADTARLAHRGNIATDLILAEARDKQLGDIKRQLRVLGSVCVKGLSARLFEVTHTDPLPV